MNADDPKPPRVAYQTEIFIKKAGYCNQVSIGVAINNALSKKKFHTGRFRGSFGYSSDGGVWFNSNLIARAPRYSSGDTIKMIQSTDGYIYLFLNSIYLHRQDLKQNLLTMQKRKITLGTTQPLITISGHDWQISFSSTPDLARRPFISTLSPSNPFPLTPEATKNLVDLEPKPFTGFVILGTKDLILKENLTKIIGRDDLVNGKIFWEHPPIFFGRMKC